MYGTSIINIGKYGNINIIRYLIKHHVNVNDNGSSENREKMKILKILRRLIDHGIHLHLISLLVINIFILLLNFLIENGADANGNENDSIVPLINVSIDKKNLFFEEVIKNIIEHGINPN
ncbi:hypothetical protein H8356DRAFT_1325853 [Neocallimastix lanati (nom. inval.)]|nr:hypothetical protein H8356DRAFT_1325853 [Neocallimastix sp. JGI-2020a]